MTVESFKIKVCGKETYVESEHFPSMHSIPTILANRKSKHPDAWRTATLYIFGGGNGYNSEWCGYRTSGELCKQIRSGIPDNAAIKTFSEKAKKTLLPRQSAVLKRDSVGAEYDLDRIRSEDPVNMVDKVYKRPKINDVRLVIETGTNGGYSGAQMTEAGIYLAKLIKSIESNGCRLSVIGSSIGYLKYSRQMSIVSVNFKKPGMNLSYPRLMFLLSPAFERGLSFGWSARSLDKICSLGAAITGYVSYDDLKNIFVRHLHDKRIVVFTLQEVMNRCTLYKGADKDKKVEDWLLKEYNRRSGNLKFVKG